MSLFIEKVNLGDELLGALEPKFVEVGAPMEEMWELVTSKSPYISRIGELTKLLHRSSNYFKRIDRLWAHDALNKASIFQQDKQLGVVPKPALPYRAFERPYYDRPSIGGPSTDGKIKSGSNTFGGPIALVVEAPWAMGTRPSPSTPSSSSLFEGHIHPPSTSGSSMADPHLQTIGYEHEGFPLSERPEPLP